MFTALMVQFLITYILTGNALGLLLVAYLRLRYGKPDASAMVEILVMWDGVALIGTVLSLLMVALVPPEMFLDLGRALLALSRSVSWFSL